eukprot:6188769-Pleurochrysis_carterae.AAC.2
MAWSAISANKLKGNPSYGRAATAGLPGVRIPRCIVENQPGQVSTRRCIQHVSIKLAFIKMYHRRKAAEHAALPARRHARCSSQRGLGKMSGWRSRSIAGSATSKSRARTELLLSPLCVTRRKRKLHVPEAIHENTHITAHTSEK